MFVLRSFSKVAVVSKTGGKQAGLIVPEAFTLGHRIVRGTGNKSTTISRTAPALKGLHMFIQEVCVVKS